jgi:hypothetical protein
MARPRPSLHLIEHLRECGFQLQRLLDFVGAHIRIFPVFKKAWAPMISHELYECGRVGLPVCREAFEVLEHGVQAGCAEQRDRVLSVLVEIGVEDGAVAICVGIDFGAIASITRLADHAARSIV